MRKIQKAMLKKAGYVRQTQRIDIIAGVPNVVHLRRGEGQIINPEGDAIGRHWPRCNAPLGTSNPFLKAGRRDAYDAALAAGSTRSEAMKVARRAV